MVKILCLNIGGNPKKPHSDGIKNRAYLHSRRALGYIPSAIQRRPHLLWCGPMRSKPINIKRKRYILTPPLKMGVDVRHAQLVYECLEFGSLKTFGEDICGLIFRSDKD